MCSYLHRICLCISASFPFILIPGFVYAFLPVFCSYLQQICLGISGKFIHIYTRVAHTFLPVFCSYLYRICLGISDTFDSFSFIATTRFAYAFLPFFPFILIHSFAHTLLLVFRSYIQRICLGISVKFVHIYTGLA